MQSAIENNTVDDAIRLVELPEFLFKPEGKKYCEKCVQTVGKYSKGLGR